MIRAVPELLPSSFTMVYITVAYGAYLRHSYFPSVFFIALAYLLGWIYVAIIGISIAIDILFNSMKSWTYYFINFFLNATTPPSYCSYPYHLNQKERFCFGPNSEERFIVHIYTLASLCDCEYQVCCRRNLAFFLFILANMRLDER